MVRTRKLAGIIATVLAAFALVFALTGCGEAEKKPTGEEFIGTWDIISMESPDQGDLDSMIALLRASGAQLNIVFQEGNKLDINIANNSDDESMTGTWQVKDFNVVTVEVDGATQEAVIGEDGLLTMEQDDVKMICEKVDPDKPKDEPTENADGAEESSSPADDDAGKAADEGQAENTPENQS